MSATASDRFEAREWGVLLVLAGAIFLEGIDVAMLNVALPSIRADLGLSTGMLSGVVSAYVLGYGGFILLGGRAADLLGRRRMFLIWLTVFLLFSGLGGLATEGWMLLVARFVTGIAAGFMAPAGLALITTNFPQGMRRTKALGVYAGVGAGGFTLGLVAGGLLTSVGWRWVFFAPVAMAAVLLLVAVPLVKDGYTPVRRERGGFDLPGACAVTGAMLLLAYGVVRLEDPGHGTGTTAAVLAGGALLLAAFVTVERRTASPLVRLGLLRSGRLVRTYLSAMLFMGSFAGFQFVVTLYLQELRGWSPLMTGLAMLVAGLDMLIAPTLTPRLVNRFGNQRVLVGGLVMGALAYALFLPLRLDWAYTAMLPALLCLGLAFALAYGPLTIAATDGVAEHELGLASGLLYTATQFGTALGISAVTAVQVAALDEATSQQAALEALRSALWVPLGAAALGAAITATGLWPRRQTAARPAGAGNGVAATAEGELPA